MVYRIAAERPTHFVLDIHCTRCGAWGLQYGYFPFQCTGPLCQTCFLKWRGVCKDWRYGVVGCGLSSWPVEWQAWVPDYPRVEVDGKSVLHPWV